MRAALAAIASLLLLGSCEGGTPTSDRLIPTPVGRGAAYQPGPRSDFACRSNGTRAAGLRVHLELFANRRVVVVPAGIGVRGARFRFGRIERGRCYGRLWTLDPTGVIWFRRDDLRLGDFFALWNRPLAPRRLLSFRARTGPLLVFRNGSRWRGDPRRLPLRNADQIVLELNGYIPPHRGYLFPPLQR